ncbi:ribonuclease R [Rhodocytophaga rosea]|uniref:Ribonuclease R n=1 Tax=Rhodocytophaga rosea TaxID=2704465 RepID=A0A6C0GHJ7_9BACT|nr:ribonuclease R [Rhodocytophaga rosea]QHT67183.1 ribonuclease R [Rhodocytophaga rosea]
MRNKKEKKERDRKSEDGSLKEKVVAFLTQHRSKAFSAAQLRRKLSLRSKKQEEELPALMDQLADTGVLNRLRNGSYKISSKTTELTGVVDHVNPRYAFIVSEESEQDIWVSTSALKGAMDGDTVKVAMYAQANGRRPEGEVVEVLQRKKDEYVGLIEVLPKYAFVIPDNKKMYTDIYVRQEQINGAKDGEKVLVKITQWPTNDRKPEGEVIQVLGKAGEHHTEMHAIMAEFGLPFSFPDKVLEESAKIEEGITQQEIAKRRDFRDITTFTIDPEDAKDFDDALSIRKLENDTWEIGVHIADVTHYVKPDTQLEKEAYRRATSVYLVDRVIPMLPEKLSNELCSLRPNEDKLTFSAVFEMDNNAKILNQWFGRTVIHSDKRFSYEQAQQVLETGQGEFSEELLLLNDLAKKLKDERFKKGAISFETIEVKFKLDENGVPLAVYPKIRKDAHKLIEEFMLLANKKVAEYVFKMKKGENKNTMVYRIHDHPDLEKIKTLSVFVKKLGYSLQVEENKVSASLNKMMDNIEGKPEQNVLQSLAIRTMAKAKYSTETTGHFGLAFPHYTHFTSPIRRYPDMMSHRLLQHYLDKGKSVDKAAYEEKSRHSSDMEKIAADAERASIKYKQVEYMRNMEDREFEGIVTGVTEFGIFVEMIETRCEGMVRMSDMDDDYYELDAENYRVMGRHTGKIIAFGDKVTVRVKDTNLEKRSIDLEFVKLGKNPSGKERVRPETKRKKQAEDETEYGFEF